MRKKQAGLYRWANEPTPTQPDSPNKAALTQIRHAARRFPRAMVSHQSAAVLHQLPLVAAHLPVSLTQPGNHRNNLVGVRRFTSAVPSHHRTRLGEISLTTIERTTVDCARYLQFSDALIIADAALRSGAKREQMEHMNWEMESKNGLRAAARILKLADAGAESAMESRLRYILIRAGFTEVVTQFKVRTPNARIFYADLALPHLGILFEYDGRAKYGSAADLLKEKQREDEIRLAGWKVVRVQASDIADEVAAIRRFRQIVHYLGGSAQ